MNIIGIICEYNPFHNGHIYHIKKIKELYPDSLIILVLNGYFLERGEISLLSKEDKVKIALKNNIDLIVELPFVYGTQAADIFAEISLTILNNFHIQKLVFGSESADKNKIKDIALKQLNDNNYDEEVKLYLNEGLNYPTALAKALNQKEFSFLPNDLLAISYTKAILKKNYSIEIVPLKRTNDYKDLTSNEPIISASNIREKIKQNQDISPYFPKETNTFLKQIDFGLFFQLLKIKILTTKDLATILDVDEGLENRLIKAIKDSHTYEEFIEKIKTKRYTYNRLNRMCIHILIGLTKEDHNPPLDYIKVLGFNKKGQDYLNKIKDSLNIPLNINKNSIIYNYEITASLIYDIITNSKTYEFEKQKQPIIDKND